MPSEVSNHVSHRGKQKATPNSTKKLSRSEIESEERENLVLWKSPFTTLNYFVLEVITKLKYFILNILCYKKTVLCLLSLLCLEYVLYKFPNPLQNTAKFIHKRTYWYSWWILLGFLSSCGFGTGLHTFVLYLGPFIAEVTIGAFECKTLDFPEPPYPDEIVCPEGNIDQTGELSLLSIIMKTQLEAILWGFGTAIGELPPYFMARSARLSGASVEDEELKEFQDLIAETNKRPISLLDNTIPLKIRLEYALHSLINKAGFIGILLCASIPNPLFDLAGMTCGHFLVPFWHFFLATFIGKALVKVHIQQIVVILIMSQKYLDFIVESISKIPVIGEKLKPQLLNLIISQKEKLHNKQTEGSGTNVIASVISFFVIVLMGSFMLSIINSFAQEYHRRLCSWRQKGEGEILLDETSKEK